MASLGIDFGSSYTTMAWINPRHDKPETIKFNGDGSVKFPSVILGTESGLELGYSALSYLEEVNKLVNEEKLEILSNFIPSIKRILDPNAIEILGDKRYIHVQLLTIFFGYLKELANAHCGTEIEFDEVTITHPVEFESTKINLLKQSLFNSGFCKVNTKMEPIAAVTGYSIDHKINEGDGILVFDFGGGTIDVAYVRRHNSSLSLLCEPKGDSMCGGQDFDMLLYEDLRKRILLEYKMDISQNGHIDYGMLNSCRRLKEHFSASNDSYDTSVLFAHNNKIVTYKYKLNREAFNNIIYQKAADAVNVAKAVLNQVKEKKLTINKVLLIGGSSQLTLVRDMLQELLPNIPLDTCGEKDVAVALGALNFEIEKEKANMSQTSDVQTVITDTDKTRKYHDTGNVIYEHNDDGVLTFNW